MGENLVSPAQPSFLQVMWPLGKVPAYLHGCLRPFSNIKTVFYSRTSDQGFHWNQIEYEGWGYSSVVEHLPGMDRSWVPSPALGGWGW